MIYLYQAKHCDKIKVEKEEFPMQNKEIVELKHKLQKIASAKDYIVQLDEQVEENEQKLYVAEEILRKENKDVEKLKRVSLSSVLSWIKKDQEERMMKEEDEAYRAALLVKQLEEERLTLQREFQKYQDLIEQEDQVEKQLTKLQMQYSSPQEQEELKQLYHNLEEEQLLEKELVEAIGAGYDCMQRLRDIESSLSNAKGWGLYDIVGGGAMSSIVKHSHINKAQAQIADAQYDLRRFQKEVNDVRNMEAIELDVSTGLSFMDIMFDNIFSDFMVQSKVNASLDSVRNVIGGISGLMDELLERQRISAEKIDTLDQELKQKLMDS